MLIQWFQECGFIYHSRIAIWKDPVVEMQRTKALGLLHKQLKKDSVMSRVGLPDYVLIFRNEGENEIPISNVNIPVDYWQKIASPVWMDIDYGNTLNYRAGKDQNDEKHICPLQLDTIERLILLYSNEGETVFSPFGGIGSEGFQALKMKRKSISINKYNKIMDSIIGQNMTVSDTFIAMIEEAGKYEIKQSEKEYKKADKK
jgi:DNA modification methylase